MIALNLYLTRALRSFEGPERGLRRKTKGDRSYIDSLREEFGETIKNFSFAVDTGNGALGPLAKKVYSALGLSPIYLFNSPDGAFPNHHPDPLQEANLLDLKKTVLKRGLDFGFAFDGDGDRLMLVNHRGESLFADQYGKLFLADCLKKGRGVGLADVKCSDRLFKFAKLKKLKLLPSPCGHSLIRAKMEKLGASLAIEFSGHIFFRDRKGRGFDRGFDDALYASLRLLEILSQREQEGTEGLKELLKCETMKATDTGEIRIDLPKEQVEEKLSKLKAYLRGRQKKQTEEQILEMDGFRISRRKGGAWALFRASKTQSALSFRLEAETEAELTKLKLEFSKLLGIKIP